MAGEQKRDIVGEERRFANDHVLGLIIVGNETLAGPAATGVETIKRRQPGLPELAHDAAQELQVMFGFL
jgi:hypothetical protein